VLKKWHIRKLFPSNSSTIERAPKNVRTKSHDPSPAQWEEQLRLKSLIRRYPGKCAPIETPVSPQEISQELLCQNPESSGKGNKINGKTALTMDVKADKVCQ
jgi:hypothetical protein